MEARRQPISSPGSSAPEPPNASTRRPQEPADDLKGGSLRIPSAKDLHRAIRDLLTVIVSSDTRSTRSEGRLNELMNLLLLKLESDRRAYAHPEERVGFRPRRDPRSTAEAIRLQFRKLRDDRPEWFAGDDASDLDLDDGTIAHAARHLAGYRLLGTVSGAAGAVIEVIRAEHRKSEEGQYFTPLPVVRSAIALMDIDVDDVVIDPACGAGSFLLEAGRRLAGRVDDEARGTWAAASLHGVDRDAVSVKLARAALTIEHGGADGIMRGDSLRSSVSRRGRYTCVVTNPPFGKSLRLSAGDARAHGFTIAERVGRRTDGDSGDPTYVDRELGLAFLEQSWRLLEAGGRLGIVLPETYFFSASYRWLADWLRARFIVRGMFNVPMESFQGFCRAKTNFYVFEKTRGDPRRRTPKWFRTGRVLVSNAPTCGVNKDGVEQYAVDSRTGQRSRSVIDDALRADADAAARGDLGAGHLSLVGAERVLDSGVMVPRYFDRTALDEFEALVETIEGCESRSLGQLVREGELAIRSGHGSPSSDQRLGTVPYIKVSDLRAGRVNVNPTNRVPLALARKHWGGEDSGLAAYDLVSPARASRNIGEFCVILPDQTRVVLTREVLVVRATAAATFDQFFLMWALSLAAVRRQWSRVVFMQTNREDVGSRALEIRIPRPSSTEVARRLAEPFRGYFEGLARLDGALAGAIASSGFELHRF